MALQGLRLQHDAAGGQVFVERQVLAELGPTQVRKQRPL